jgi:ABC-type dipeptide/oligopeptide/nickel transport system permease component/ABC-type transport system substrate-binding protein
MTHKAILKSGSKWKHLLFLSIALIIIYALGYIYSAFIMPDTVPKKLPYTKKEIAEAVKNYTPLSKITSNPTYWVKITNSEYAKTDNFFKNNPDVSIKTIKKDIKENKLPKWYPNGQSPLLTKLEKEGKLQNVAQRVGPDPLVLKGWDTPVGKYGGTWTRLASGPGDIRNVIEYRLGSSYLFRMSPMGYPVVPNMVKSYKKIDNGKIWEITLRKCRWSDGVPVTSDDIMFWWDAECHSKEVDSAPPSWMMINGKYGKVVKIDKHTVRFEFSKPYGVFLERLAHERVLIPKHYLIKYHPTLGNPKFIKEEMAKYGFSSSRQLYELARNVINPAMPVLTPWMLKTYSDGPPATLVRNPYYYAVDEKGNQLPYIDRIFFEYVDKNMLPIAAAQGHTSMQYRGIENFMYYTDVMSQAKKNNMRILCWPTGSTGGYCLFPNLNRKIDPNYPGTKWKKELLAQKKFRQALSISINRKEINDAINFGVPLIGQTEPGPTSPFYSPLLKNAWIKYNPEKANKMLDDLWKSLGWDPNKRVDGFRCGPKGKLLTFYLTSTVSRDPFSPFIVEDFAAIGIRIISRQVSRTLYDSIKKSLNYDFLTWGSNSEVTPLISSSSFLATNDQAKYAEGWAMWYKMGGMHDSPDSKNPGCIPVPKSSPMYTALQYYEKALQSTTLKKQKYYMDKVFEIAADNIWMITAARNGPTVGIASNNMKNIPPKVVNCAYYSTSSNGGPETFYFENPSHIGDKDTLYQITHLKPWPYMNRSNSQQSASSSVFKGIISWLIAIIFIGGLITLAIRHKFVLRRLIIMVPTLIVISICVFTIIQIPPGNFLSAKIMELEESGVAPDQIENQVKSLKIMFDFDKPAWEKYIKWLGIKWFTTFKSSDKGLLQGYMGRSMETNNSVNSMVGDRILLTFIISLGTIILTWLLAIPIGIYSACKQYSVGDYFFTFFGFIGMCLPGFLIALIFLALTGLSGLFSPKFSMQPFWDWPKVADLLKHIWIPIIIVGFNGTASMIRVMRANLLDELKKPYVTTAKAKGVKPLKLLFKYPVRLAFNPFISGIGTLFPQLVSGSSIVAIVLSLPTVGPMLLNALFLQDMNVAASMLMVLATLGVLGTLISDLLLLVLDPRIRLAGGKAK